MDKNLIDEIACYLKTHNNYQPNSSIFKPMQTSSIVHNYSLNMKALDQGTTSATGIGSNLSFPQFPGTLLALVVEPGVISYGVFRRNAEG